MKYEMVSPHRTHNVVVSRALPPCVHRTATATTTPDVSHSFSCLFHSCLLNPCTKSNQDRLLEGRLFFSCSKGYPLMVSSVIQYKPQEEQAKRARQKRIDERGAEAFQIPKRWRPHPVSPHAPLRTHDLMEPSAGPIEVRTVKERFRVFVFSRGIPDHRPDALRVAEIGEASATRICCRLAPARLAGTAVSAVPQAALLQPSSGAVAAASKAKEKAP